MATIERQLPVQREGRPSWLPPEEFPFESRFLDLDGHRIHYVDEGSGPPLLFVTAGAVWSFVFRPLIERLRDRYRCIALDLPGAGLSRAADGYETGLKPASRVVERFVLSLGLRDVTVVLHDLGVGIALGAAARHPERFQAIVVIEGFGWSLQDENPKVARMLRVVGGRTVRAVNGATNILARASTMSFGVGRHLSRAGKRAFRGPFGDRGARRDALLMLRDASHADDYLRTVDRALRTTLSDRPLLLVFGEKSPARKAGFPDQWKSRFPEAALVVVEGGHHFPQMDEPDLVADAIRSWGAERVAPAGRRG
jgi:haloalkane dehalogenase